MHWLTQIGSAIGWYLVLFWFGGLAFPWTGLVFRRFPDRGYGASRIAGLLAFTFVTWWLGNAGLRCTPTLLYGVLAVTTIATVALVSRNHRLRADLVRTFRNRGWQIELAVLAVFVLATVIRAFQPEIFWGEKPMDFTFFNYFSRLETLPPEDPWASDRPIRYYYMGNWMFGLLEKLTGIDTGVGYNLALITLPTLAFGAFVSGLLPMVRRTRWAIAGAVVPLVLANGEAFRMLLTGDYKRIDFDFFWATSRILRHSVANEYPLWSYLFGDLHAHVMGLPCAALLLTFFVGLLAQKKRPPAWRGISMRIAVGAAWGATFPVNGWDAIAYGVVIPVTLALWSPARVFRDAPRSAIGRRVLDVGLVFLGAFFVAYPFWESILPTAGSMNHGWTQNEFHGLSALWRMGAVVWLPLLALAILRTLRGAPGRHRILTYGWKNFAHEEPSRRPRRWEDWMKWVPLIVLTGLAVHPAFRERPWSNLFTGAVLFAAAGALRFGAGQSGTRRTVGALLGGGAALFLFIESYWLVERMNSLFKLHYALWLLCSFLVAASLPSLVRGAAMAFREVPRRDRPRFRRAVLAVSGALTVLPAAATVAGSTVALFVMMTFQRVPGPRPSLDGTAYLQNVAPDDAGAIRWLRENAANGSVVLEAQGDAYREFTRIAMHTGLPTVLGWEHHVKQRGTPPQEVENRKRDIETMYVTQDDAERQRLFDRYGVRYVVVGEVERNHYGKDRLAMWPKYRETPSKGHARVRLAYDSARTQVFAVAPPEPSERALSARE